MHDAIVPGSPFPSIRVTDLDGVTADISQPRGELEWKAVFVYRGQHCPLCTRYLNRLTSFVPRLHQLVVDVVDVVAVSGDSEAQLRGHLERLNVNFPLYRDLSLEQMRRLGVYVSTPRSEKETDHPFAEPGLFVINGEGRVQVVDLSNNPFARPDLEALVSGLRGTHPA